jgi:hypothetical protein
LRGTRADDSPPRAALVFGISLEMYDRVQVSQFRGQGSEPRHYYTLAFGKLTEPNYVVIFVAREESVRMTTPRPR